MLETAVSRKILLKAAERERDRSFKRGKSPYSASERVKWTSVGTISRQKPLTATRKCAILLISRKNRFTAQPEGVNEKESRRVPGVLQRYTSVRCRSNIYFPIPQGGLSQKSFLEISTPAFFVIFS
ncbi:hypothetical protein PAECIP111893_00085 [Paenibacillus plantiphilus]|uniref:Resolvase/invertase-type recombinase catalytic domain-containing protein n=1 Tax=Paenibacillus plantiphilus TaxID=2905650 RepID=A0ABN8FWB2_9BACL|nr:hypothetical protein PAECIP111893_00085 [Paenibacillus plantiphilus]